MRQINKNVRAYTYTMIHIYASQRAVSTTIKNMFFFRLSSFRSFTVHSLGVLIFEASVWCLKIEMFFFFFFFHCLNRDLSIRIYVESSLFRHQTRIWYGMYIYLDGGSCILRRQRQRSLYLWWHRKEWSATLIQSIEEMHITHNTKKRLSFLSLNCCWMWWRRNGKQCSRRMVECNSRKKRALSSSFAWFTLNIINNMPSAGGFFCSCRYEFDNSRRDFFYLMMSTQNIVAHTGIFTIRSFTGVVSDNNNIILPNAWIHIHKSNRFIGILIDCLAIFDNAINANW